MNFIPSKSFARIFYIHIFAPGVGAAKRLIFFDFSPPWFVSKETNRDWFNIKNTQSVLTCKDTSHPTEGLCQMSKMSCFPDYGPCRHEPRHKDTSQPAEDLRQMGKMSCFPGYGSCRHEPRHKDTSHPMKDLRQMV